MDKSPFTITGASNVFLETIKRGEDDDKKTTTIVLRIYEALGGHAVAKLNIGAGIEVKKAVLTNLLEDEEGSEVLTVDGPSVEGEGKSLKLSFHRFEVKTVKVTIGKAKE